LRELVLIIFIAKNIISTVEVETRKSKASFTSTYG